MIPTMKVRGAFGLGTNQTLFQALLTRIGMSRQRATEITTLSINSIRKACYDKSPKGWVALCIEVDRLHRIDKAVIEAENALLKAQLDALRDKA